MSLISVRVPQLGESVREARIIAFLKQEGEEVRKDEPLLEVETDKAVYTVESPEAGIVEQWNADVGATLPVGAVLVNIRPPQAAAVAPEAIALETVPPQVEPAPLEPESIESKPALRNRNLSPRARAWCREHGVAEETVSALNTQTDRPVQVADIEKCLVREAGPHYREVPLSQHQRALNSRLAYSWRTAVPSWAEIRCDWESIKRARNGGPIDGLRLTASELLAWSIVLGMRENPRFRSTLSGQDVLREYDRAVLGVAVALPDDELVTVPIPDVSNFEDFVRGMRNAVRNPERRDAVPGEAQVLFTYVAGFGLHSAAPMVVPPAMATVFVGTPWEELRSTADGRLHTVKTFSIVLAFDHRILNGAAAARFLQTVRVAIERSGRTEALPLQAAAAS